VVTRLRKLDPDRMTPMEAMNVLSVVRDELRSREGGVTGEASE
jgi:hypothetical protein